MELTISQLADEVGVSVAAVRHYEQEGLLHPVGRTQSNYRIYDETSLDRIKFIKSAQKLGFSLLEIGQLLKLDGLPNACPSALDYLIKKSFDLKNQITQLTNQRDNIESLMKKCHGNANGGASEFFNYLEKIPVSPSSELIFCRHSYLFDVGSWSLVGNFQQNGQASVGITGSVDIKHVNNLWEVTRTIVLKDKDKSEETIAFHIPIAPPEDVDQKFVADCSVFGDVRGSIAFAGEDIFKYYDMVDHKVRGYEYLKRIHSDLYEANGVLSDGSISISWWDYRLERTQRSLSS